MARRGDSHRVVRWLWTSRRPDARLVRLALLPAAALWRGVMATRESAYRRGWLQVHDLPLPSVAIGNLTVGGSGKTPIAIWTARYYVSRGLVPGILLRGYGNDEVLVHQHAVPDLPDDALVFLLGSRYCETDLLSEAAWKLFGSTPTGWARVQAICDFVHAHVSFGYEHASPTKTAFQVFAERRGVCRDYAHLAIAFCRCMNIPARYCTGYLGDIGVPLPHDTPDFAAWFEAFLGGRWYTFDARNNQPRIGRVLIARGRNASDVAISSTFGPNKLVTFRVWTDEVPPVQLPLQPEHAGCIDSASTR